MERDVFERRKHVPSKKKSSSKSKPRSRRRVKKRGVKRGGVKKGRAKKGVSEAKKGVSEPTAQQIRHSVGSEYLKGSIQRRIQQGPTLVWQDNQQTDDPEEEDYADDDFDGADDGFQATGDDADAEDAYNLDDFECDEAVDAADVVGAAAEDGDDGIDYELDFETDSPTHANRRDSLAAELASRGGEEQAKSVAEEQAKRVAEEQAKSVAEEQAKSVAEEQAKSVAEEERFKRQLEERIRRKAEEHAKEEAKVVAATTAARAAALAAFASTTADQAVVAATVAVNSAAVCNIAAAAAVIGFKAAEAGVGAATHALAAAGRAAAAAAAAVAAVATAVVSRCATGAAIAVAAAVATSSAATADVCAISAIVATAAAVTAAEAEVAAAAVLRAAVAIAAAVADMASEGAVDAAEVAAVATAASRAEKEQQGRVSVLQSRVGLFDLSETEAESDGEVSTPMFGPTAGATVTAPTLLVSEGLASAAEGTEPMEAPANFLCQPKPNLLSVVLHSVSNLPNSVCPTVFCELTLAGCMQRTTAKQAFGDRVVWEETFTFSLSDTSHTISLDVYQAPMPGTLASAQTCGVFPIGSVKVPDIGTEAGKLQRTEFGLRGSDPSFQSSTVYMEINRVVEEKQPSVASPTKPMRARVLPHDWMEFKDATSGVLFYRNVKTNEQQTTLPAQLNELKSALLPGDGQAKGTESDMFLMGEEGGGGASGAPLTSVEHQQLLQQEPAMVSVLQSHDMFAMSDSEGEGGAPLVTPLVSDEQPLISGMEPPMAAGGAVAFEQQEQPAMVSVLQGHDMFAMSDSEGEGGAVTDPFGMLQTAAAPTLAPAPAPAPAPTPAQVLVSEWTELKDEASGMLFYHNSTTNVTQWEKPAELQDPISTTEDAFFGDIDISGDDNEDEDPLFRL
jgi:hypothetical protein